MDTDREIPKRMVVYGGGVIGVCAAYFLSKKGTAVTVMEKFAVACAASGKAGGFLALDWCDGKPLGPLARANFNLHHFLTEDLDDTISYGYRHLTTLSATFTESKLGSPQGRGLLPDWIDGLGRGPREIGSTDTTAQVHPQMFTSAILERAVGRYRVEVVKGRVEQVGVGEGG